MKRALFIVITISLVIPFAAQSKTTRVSDEATIYRDEYGIPHVFAQTLEAASFAVGLRASRRPPRRAAQELPQSERHDG